jgi:hypothetical protein
MPEPGKPEIVSVDPHDHARSAGRFDLSVGPEHHLASVRVPSTGHAVPVGIVLPVFNEEKFTVVDRHLVDPVRGRRRGARHAQILAPRQLDRLLPSEQDLVERARFGRDQSVEIPGTLVHQPPLADARRARVHVPQRRQPELESEHQRRRAEKSDFVSLLAFRLRKDDPLGHSERAVLHGQALAVEFIRREDFLQILQAEKNGSNVPRRGVEIEIDIAAHAGVEDDEAVKG